MPGYVYRGYDLHLPPRAPGGRPKTGLAPFNPDLCGTNAGYHQHNRQGCKDAHKAYDAEYRAQRKAAGIKRKRN